MSTAAESIKLRADHETFTIMPPETPPTIEELRAQFAAGTLDWPERPTCHDGDWHAGRYGGTTWRSPAGRYPYAGRDGYPDDCPPGSDDETYRTCSYCGSMHPEDLARVVLAVPPAKLGGSDWKYGWPHKFYVENIPNPAAGLPACCGSASGPVYEEDGKTIKRDEHGQVVRYFTPHISTASATMTAKWYNEHLKDVNEPTFLFLSALLQRLTHIRFFVEDGRLYCIAPFHGYQTGFHHVPDAHDAALDAPHP